jgi:hypothetical protein
MANNTRPTKKKKKRAKRRNRGRRCSHELAIKEAMIWLGENREEGKKQEEGSRRKWQLCVH